MSEANERKSESLHHSGSEPHLLREIVRTHQVLMAGFTRRVGIPASQFQLLRLLATAESDVGTTDLARTLGINAAAVTRQLQDLEREQLVLRYSDPKDGRRSHVRLSAKGRKLFGKIHDRTHELERLVTAELGREEMTRAAATLIKLRALVERLQRDSNGGTP